MTVLSESQAREFAAILDGYEDMIATANAGKRDTLDDIREILRAAGLKGKDLADELANFRSGAADARLLRTNPEKADRKEKRRDGATDYLFLLTRKASRTHEADFSAGDDRAQTDAVTPHDPDTGEILEQNATLPDADEIMPQLPVKRVNRPEGDHASEPGTEEACRSGVKASAANSIPEPGAGVESMGNGAQAEPAETMPEPNPGNAAGRTAEDDVETSAVGASPTPLPKQIHKAIGGAPLSPQPEKPVVVDIPEIFRRDPDAKHWQKTGGTA